MLRFDDCFWGTGEDPTVGVRTLHKVFMQHLAEAEDLLAMVRSRVAMEEQHALHLLELGRHSGAGSGGTSEKDRRRYSRASTPAIAAGTMTGLAGDKTKLSLNNIAQGLGNAAALLQSAAASSRLAGNTSWSLTAEPESDTSTIGPIDDESSIRPVIRTIREQMVAMAAIHRRHADTLTLAVISPLQAFVEQHRRAMTKKKNEVDLNHQQLSRLAADIEARRALYLQKCRIAEEEDRKFREDGESRARRLSAGPVMIGSRSVGPNEFQSIVETMRKEVRTKSIMTDLGLFEGCFMGDDAVEHLRKRYPGVPRGDLRNVCQEILDRRLITVVVGPNDATFDTGLPYQFGRPLLKSGEPPHVKARKDAEMARLDYDTAIKTAEHTRSALEFHITDYLIAAQDAERYRLKVIQEAALALESAQIFAVDETRTAWKPSALVDAEPSSATSLLNSPDPEAGVQYIATRYRTGHLRSKPFVFESYKDGRAPHQVFGIGFEELSRATNTAIPPIVRKCVTSLYESLLNGRSSVDSWITPNPDLPSVQFLRMEFNSSPKGGRVSSATLRRYQPQVVAGVLKLYLVEAPISLCSYDTYETLRMLYSDDFQQMDDDVRVKSVRSLLSTLTPPHYDTLKLFAGYLHELAQNLDDSDDRIMRLSYSLAPCILRPKTETSDTLQDQHPWRFTLELIVRYPSFFGEVDGAFFIQGANEPSPPPSPEPESGNEFDPDVRVTPTSVVESLHIKGMTNGVAAGTTTPPNTPPLREPTTPKGSWFSWPLTGNGNGNENGNAGVATPLTSNASSGETKSEGATDGNLDGATTTKSERRASRLEERLAGVLARSKARVGAAPVPTSEDEVSLEGDVQTPSEEGRESPSEPIAATEATKALPLENPWTSLKSFLNKKRSSNSSTSTSSSGRQTPESNAVFAPKLPTPPALAITPTVERLTEVDRVESATPPISAGSATDLLYKDAPASAHAAPGETNSPASDASQPKVSRSASVASVASVAKSFFGSVVGIGIGSVAEAEEGAKPSEEKEKKLEDKAEDVAEEISEQVRELSGSPYEEIINGSHQNDHSEGGEDVGDQYETQTEGDDGRSQYDDTQSHYTDGQSQYDDTQSHYAEEEEEDDEEEDEEAEEGGDEEQDGEVEVYEEEEYEETEEVVIIEDEAEYEETEEPEEQQEDVQEHDDYEEMQSHMFPASGEDLNEYLQWG